MIHIYASVDKGPAELVETCDDIDVTRNMLFKLREEAENERLRVEYWSETSED